MKMTQAQLLMYDEALRQLNQKKKSQPKKLTGKAKELLYQKAGGK